MNMKSTPLLQLSPLQILERHRTPTTSNQRRRLATPHRLEDTVHTLCEPGIPLSQVHASNGRAKTRHTIPAASAALPVTQAVHALLRGRRHGQQHCRSHRHTLDPVLDQPTNSVSIPPRAWCASSYLRATASDYDSRTACETHQPDGGVAVHAFYPLPVRTSKPHDWLRATLPREHRGRRLIDQGSAANLTVHVPDARWRPMTPASRPHSMKARKPSGTPTACGRVDRSTSTHA